MLAHSHHLQAYHSWRISSTHSFDEWIKFAELKWNIQLDYLVHFQYNTWLGQPCQYYCWFFKLPWPRCKKKCVDFILNLSYEINCVCLITSKKYFTGKKHIQQSMSNRTDPDGENTNPTFLYVLLRRKILWQDDKCNQWG